MQNRRCRRTQMTFTTGWSLPWSFIYLTLLLRSQSATEQRLPFGQRISLAAAAFNSIGRVDRCVACAQFPGAISLRTNRVFWGAQGLSICPNGKALCRVSIRLNPFQQVVSASCVYSTVFFYRNNKAVRNITAQKKKRRIQGVCKGYTHCLWCIDILNAEISVGCSSSGATTAHQTKRSSEM